MKTKLLFTVTILLLFTSFSLSQGKWKVYVEHSGDDMLGKQLASHLREGLSHKESFFHLVPRDEAELVVRLATMSIPESGEADVSVFSMTLTVKFPPDAREAYCDQSIGYFGWSHIMETVNFAMATVGKAAAECLGEGMRTEK